MSRRLICSVAIASLCALVSACATSPAVQEQRRKELQRSVEQFHRAMSWEMIDKATKQVSPEFEQNFRGRYEEYGDDLDIVSLRIESVELQETLPGDESSVTSARVEVKQKWYVEPDMTVNEERYVEIWEYKPAGWRLTKRLPHARWESRQDRDAQSDSTETRGPKTRQK